MEGTFDHKTQVFKVTWNSESSSGAGWKIQTSSVGWSCFMAFFCSWIGWYNLKNRFGRQAISGCLFKTCCIFYPWNTKALSVFRFANLQHTGTVHCAYVLQKIFCRVVLWESEGKFLNSLRHIKQAPKNLRNGLHKHNWKVLFWMSSAVL